MESTVTLTPLASLNEHIAMIAAEQERLQIERKRLFVNTRDRYPKAHIVGQIYRGPKLRRGHKVQVWETLHDHYGRGWERDVHYTPIYKEDAPIEHWGPRIDPAGNTIWLDRGPFACVLADDDAVVLAEIPYTPTAIQVRRAVARLRTLARREHLKISARDTAIVIKSPMNDVVFEGELESAFLWLCGLSEQNIPDRMTDFDRALEGIAA